MVLIIIIEVIFVVHQIIRLPIVLPSKCHVMPLSPNALMARVDK